MKPIDEFVDEQIWRELLDLVAKLPPDAPWLRFESEEWQQELGWKIDDESLEDDT